ncbi:MULTISPECIES: acyl-CoA thioesterase family protein [Streptomyces]|uniref:hypothetical protein n=1 Tax=Streptomyces TaxID=1883 RepID=UPI001670C533|nr:MULTISPECIES: hypothetical protein [Streptomyces]MEE1809631.1 hypothetical protein [Streptomyces sp. BE133]WPW30994.1 hypothetical protein P6B95_28840 [Streptomyces atratus]GGT17794.1 hypothetical protein GCM10010207_16350 [Streptomyces atratus]
MTIVTETAVKALLAETTSVQVRPRYEGSNICTWIGFKHVNYMVEEAVLDHFRQAALPARGLYEEHGLGLDIVGIDTRILHAFHMDDIATAEVVPFTKDADGTLGFKVIVSVERDGEILKAVTSKVRVSLRIDTYLDSAGEVPDGLARFAVDRLGADLEPAPLTPFTSEDTVLDELLEGKNAYGWKWNIPYPYCHFTERLQMSGYLRLMEEGKDRFVADRGISIKTLLDDRRWIPVVPRSEIRILDEAMMEEDLYTTYEVEDVFKDFTYTTRMNWYVVRDGKLLKTATGTIVHGYAVIKNRRDWSLENFDQHVLDALNGTTRQP